MSEFADVGIHRVNQLSCGRHSEYLYHLNDDARQTEVRVVRRRRKTMALYVEKGALTELRVPTNCPWNDIHDFLESRFDWILAAEKELESRVAGAIDRFHPGGEVSFLGKRYSLEIVKSRFGVVELGEEGLYVSCSNPQSTRLVERLVLAWLRKQAGVIFQERISAVVPLFPDESLPDTSGPSALTVRKMRARWGSCSTKGEICLNLMLIREKLSQIDFVIAHELCHLRHFAHNGAFYSLLDEVMPDWRDRELELGRTT